MTYTTILKQTFAEVDNLASNVYHLCRPYVFATKVPNEILMKQEKMLLLWRDLWDHLKLMEAPGGFCEGYLARFIDPGQAERAFQSWKDSQVHSWVSNLPSTTGRKVVVVDRSRVVAGLASEFVAHSGSTVVLLPDVVRALKVGHYPFTTPLMDWVLTGKLLTGLELSTEVTVLAITNETSAPTLSWLHPNLVEDLFITQVLRLWRENPYWELSIDTNDPLVALKAQRAWIPLWSGES